MTERFNGFSQEEINRVSGEKKTSLKQPLKQAFRGQHIGIRRMPEKWSKATTQQIRTVQNNQNQRPSSSKESEIKTNAAGMANKNMTKKEPPNDMLEGVNLDASMSKSLEDALFNPLKENKSPKDSAKVGKNNLAANNISTEDSGNDSSILKLPENLSSNANGSDDSSLLTDAKIVNGANSPFVPPYALNTDSPFKGISLKDFESHRKMIQEQNKQKKEMLYKAIEHHSKKTAEEARKIEEIKSELAKLDSDLAVDVAILRKQIDNACVHFSNVEKQYMKIEAQFLKAKLDLHNAAERKELLTEHLCTVIAHNEDRKAQKLTELMEKVGLTENEVQFDGITN